MRTAYAALLDASAAAAASSCRSSRPRARTGAVMFMLVGRDFFPAIDGGQIQLHVRAPAGTRIESTEQIFQAVEDKIREVIPERDRELIVDNIGLPARTYNLAFTDGSTIGVNDGMILVSLKEGHAPTADYVRRLRERAAGGVPGGRFYFQPADMVTQILNFGIAGADRRAHRRLRPGDKPRSREGASAASRGDARHRRCAFAAGARRARSSTPRSTAAARSELGLNASTIANNINISLSSSVQVSPNFWTDPTSGIPYYLAVQTPESRSSSLNDLGNTPVSAALPRERRPGAGTAQQCRDVCARERADQYQPVEHPADLRRLCQRSGPRSRQRRRRHQQDRRRSANASSSPATAFRSSARSRA